MTFFRLNLLVSNLGSSIIAYVDILSLVSVVWIWSRVDLSKQHLLFALGQSGPFDNTRTELKSNSWWIGRSPKRLRDWAYGSGQKDVSVHRSHDATTVYVWGENSGKGH